MHRVSYVFCKLDTFDMLFFRMKRYDSLSKGLRMYLQLFQKMIILLCAVVAVRLIYSICKDATVDKREIAHL